MQKWVFGTQKREKSLNRVQKCFPLKRVDMSIRYTDHSPKATILRKRPFSESDHSPKATIHRKRPFSESDHSPKATILRKRPFSESDHSPNDQFRKRPILGKLIIAKPFQNFYTFSRIFSLCCTRFFIFTTGDRRQVPDYRYIITVYG
jgi:hypothetical protein